MESFQNYTWIFSDIGTEIIFFILTTGLGVFFTYKVTRNNKVCQQQNAGKNSKQFQVMKLNNSSRIMKSDIQLNQIQKAGDNTKQKQIGEIDNDE